MNNVYKISLLQLISIPFFLYNSINITPHIMLSSAQDAWYTVIVATIAEIIIIKIFLIFAKKLKNKDIVEYSKVVAGKYLGSFLSIILLVGIFLQFILLLNISSGYIQSNLLPNIDIILISFISIIVIIYATKLGVESFTRIGFLVFTFFFILTILGALGVIFQAELSYIKPMFSKGFIRPLRSILLILTVNTFWLSLLLFFPPSTLDNPDDYNKGVWIGYLIAKVTFFIRIFINILVLGGEYPTYFRNNNVEIIRKFFISEFTQRFDIILLVDTSLSSIFSLIIFFYCINVGLQKLFNLKEARYFAIPLALLSLGLIKIIIPSAIFSDTWIFSGNIFYSFFIAFFIPLVILIIGLINRKKQNEKEEASY